MEKRIFLPLLILVYFALAVGYSIVTPAATADQHNPDENAHMEYVAKMASGHLPVFTDPQHGYEFHQPPLYYALCVPVYLATRGHGEAAATKAVRSVSLLLGGLLIWVTFLAVAALVPEEPLLALATSAVVGLLPSNLAVSASVTNDSLTTLICAAALWQLIRLIRNLEGSSLPGDWRRQAIWLGVTLGVGVWTKSLTLSLFPTVLIAFLLLARAGKISGRQAALGAAYAVGVGALLGMPWLARNTVLYGDALAQHVLFVQLNNGGNNVPIDQMIALFGGLGGYFLKVAQWTFASYWGGFDSMRLFWDQSPSKAHPNFLSGLSPTYLWLLLLSMLPLSGIVWRLRRSRESFTRSLALAALAIQVLFTGIAFLNYNLHFFQAQGRYLYPALLPLSFFFVWGWSGLLARPPWFRAFIGLMAVGLIGLNLYTLFALLLPRFS